MNITFCTLLCFSVCLGFGMVKIDLRTKSCSGVVSTQYNFNRCSIINFKEPVKKLFSLVLWVSVHLALCCLPCSFVICSDFNEHLPISPRQVEFWLGTKVLRRRRRILPLVIRICWVLFSGDIKYMYFFGQYLIFILSWICIWVLKTLLPF